jgi:hypothetical protein
LSKMRVGDIWSAKYKGAFLSFLSQSNPKMSRAHLFHQHLQLSRTAKFHFPPKKNTYKLHSSPVFIKTSHYRYQYRVTEEQSYSSVIVTNSPTFTLLHLLLIKKKKSKKKKNHSPSSKGTSPSSGNAATTPSTISIN